MAIDWNEVTRHGGVPKSSKPPSAVAIAKAKGPVAKQRHRKALANARTKSAIRDHVREDDGYRCRWPECDTNPETPSGALEVAHYQAAGSGGDPMLERYVSENLITCCHFHHRSGPHSLHSGLGRLESLSELGMRGSVMFLRKEDGEGGRWFLVGITAPPKAS